MMAFRTTDPRATLLVAALALTTLLPLRAQADGANPDPGHLRQTVLMILRFPPEGQPGALTVAEEAHINTQLDAAAGFLWVESGQSLMVKFHTVKIGQTMQAADYKAYTGGAAAKYGSSMHSVIAGRGINPKDYAGVMMIYRKTNAPAGVFNNTWIYFDEELSGERDQPGFSSVLFNSTNILHEIVVHEYLHQIDHRFQYEANNPDGLHRGFMNPDLLGSEGPGLSQWLGIPVSTPREFYRAILKAYRGSDGNYHRVNYRWLEGPRGAFYGDQAKGLYDFRRTDDLLVHYSGDNIKYIASNTSPYSFNFRAHPGQTAAFSTQTAFGRYILKSVAFNYEIHPRDFTFQVWVSYYNSKGVRTLRRIDDGRYTLGRGKFSGNRKVIPINAWAEDFQIIFRKSNLLTSDIYNDWILLGNIVVDFDRAP